MQACQQGNLQIIECLLKAEIEKRTKALTSSEVLPKELMEHQVAKFLELEDELSHGDPSGLTPLHFASTKEVAQLLYTYGAVDTRDQNGQTPQEVAKARCKQVFDDLDN